MHHGKRSSRQRQPASGAWLSVIRSVRGDPAPRCQVSPSPGEPIAATANRHQGAFAAAVIIPTILRPSLVPAALSVFQQNVDKPCQLLIGVDKPIGEASLLNEVMQACPPNWSVMVFDPGYSTSVRHGGIHPARDGGALRTILSYAANSRYLAYLDDDNWWAPDHLSTLLKAISGVDYAYGYRWFVEAASDQPACVDSWESVGPEQGIFAQRFGGFIDPNTLMLDKTRCEPVLRLWSIPLRGDPKGMSADRNVFHILNTRYTCRCTGVSSCFYRMDPQDGLHAKRRERITKAQGG